MVAALGAALVLGASVPLGAHASAACDAVEAVGDWESVAAPSFPDGGARELTAYAVDPFSPERLWATNGSSLQLSEDGGCSWEGVFEIDLLPSLEIPTSGAIASIREIVVPPSRATREVVYLVVEEDVAGVRRPHVLKSDDLGRSWRAVGPGLPAVGRAHRLRVAAADPNLLYLLVDEPGLGSRIYASEDEGATWERRGAAPAAIDFEVSDGQTHELWLWGNYLLRSLDGGETMIEIDHTSPPVIMGDVFQARGKPARIVAYEAEGGAFVRSDDGGRTWTPFSNHVGRPVSLSGGGAPDELYLSVNDAVFRFQAPRHWIEITPGLKDGIELPEDYEDLKALTTDRTAEPSLHGYTSRAIWRYERSFLDLPPLQPQMPSGEGGDASLTPADRKLVLEPGEQTTVEYSLDLPPQPTPLDVVFIMDTTVSMSSSIKGLLDGLHRIVSELSAAKIDVQFGVAEYKDYPSPGIGDFGAGDFPYRLNRPVGAADDSLVEAIERMEATGGGDIPENQLGALYQLVTGAGDEPLVEPGQNAGFRPDALKVVINITDAPFHDGPQHPAPPFDQVAAELSAREVLQIGLAVFGQNGNAGALRDLGRMASDTRTVAGPGGVDCDGDGARDIPQGGPLVCEIREEKSDGVARLTPSILATLRAVTDLAPVELVVARGENLVKEVSPGLLEGVDVKSPQVLPYEVTYSCPMAPGSGGSVELIGTVRGVGVAAASARVVCRHADEKKPRLPEDEPVPPAAIPPEPAVAIVPVPAPVPPPAPVPQAQPQPQPNPHVQGAAAHQEQEQIQVALATARTELGQEYAFSSYERRGRGAEMGALLLQGMAGLMAASVAFALRRRTAVARQRR